MTLAPIEETDRELYRQVLLVHRNEDLSVAYRVCFIPDKLAKRGSSIRFKGDPRSWFIENCWAKRFGAPEREWLKHRQRTDVKKGTFAKASPQSDS